MNYYERHIGDYLKDTAHLSLLEHGIYTRLLDVYYTREGAIPDEQVARLISARSKEEREALASVLSEFFARTEAGWSQSRCDREIAEYLDKQPGARAKKDSDRERQRRSRERRKTLFDELRKHGVVAPWDSTTEQLQDSLSRVACRVTNVPVQTNVTPAVTSDTQPVTEPVTRDNTATQTPDTTTQTPDTNPHIGKDNTHTRSTPTLVGAVCIALRANGVAAVNPSHPDLIDLVESGAQIQEFVDASRLAVERGKGFPYLIGIVKTRREEAQRLAEQAKTTTKQGSSHGSHQVEEPA